MHWRVLFIVLASIAIKLSLTGSVDLVEDEAYYAWWSKELKWGYLDHPPLVAWLGAIFPFPSSAFELRIVDVLLATISMICFVNLIRRALLVPNIVKVEAAALFFSFSIAGLIFGVLHTPDVGVNACWVIVLHEAAVALMSQPKRWLSAGFFTGLGLLSKYTMVLMLPVLFLGTFYGDREQLKTRWPYFGLGIALLVFLPHLFWNAQNDWLTMRFQLKRGFSQSHLKVEQQVPWTLSKASSQSPEFAVGQYFYDEGLEPIEKPKRTGWSKVYRNVSSYLSALLSLWGLMLFPLVLMFFRSSYRELVPTVQPKLRTLFILSATLPVVFFLLVSFVSKVEANWASFYIAGASILLGSAISTGAMKILRIAAAINGVIALGLICVYVFLPNYGIARLERETNGYAELADIVAKSSVGASVPILFDTYQTGAMLAHYAPGLSLLQYPGLARSSQFLFEAVPSRNDLDTQTLIVVQHNRTPVYALGYDLLESTEVRSCAGHSVSTWVYNRSLAYTNHCEGQTLRRWFITKYLAKKG